MTSAAKTAWPALKLPHGVKVDTRIAPHILVRSAVFSALEYAGAAQRPTIVRGEPLRLGATSQYRVEQLEGPRLSQSDADLFFWLLARAYRDSVPTGSATVFFKRSEALAALGRSRGGKTDTLFDDSLQRLCLAEFKFEQRAPKEEMRPLVRTRFLAKVERPPNTTAPYDYRVMLSDGVAALLEGGAWLALSGKARNALGSDPLAKGLHAYFASNKLVFDTRPATLKEITGRESTKQNSKWLLALDAALQKISAVSMWPQCELARTGPSAGMVVVRKGVPRRKAASDEATT
ncbi:hypothetical protein [Burkholderia paludis]|uniref:hypothetical protein n=1 Tax=Burkholderia paludis TaxID=1506587 RepID=UPI00126A4B9B|nr:hypothetical protein [Burkholderia paludis]